VPSPTLDVAHRLRRLGAAAALFDLQAMDNARRVHPELEYAESSFAAARDADLVVLLTEWEEFRRIEPKGLEMNNTLNRACRSR
jgi:UDPglucose 6-dehydrogenase